MAAKKRRADLCPVCNIRPKTTSHRGRCAACYQAVRRLIAEGKITWEQAEARGLIEPKAYRMSPMRKLAEATAPKGKRAS